jgi:hypothetical protein
MLHFVLHIHFFLHPLYVLVHPFTNVNIEVKLNAARDPGLEEKAEVGKVKKQ